MWNTSSMKDLLCVKIASSQELKPSDLAQMLIVSSFQLLWYLLSL